MKDKHKLTEEQIKWCIQLHNDHVSLAGITSILIHRGVEEFGYYKLRKYIFKELQRIASFRDKKYVQKTHYDEIE